MKRHYEVYVGNIGLIHTGNNKREAEKIYRLYVAKSQHNEGRGAGESVTLIQDDDIEAEYIGTMQDAT